MLAKSLSRKIANIDGISPPFIPTGSDHVYWLYHIHIDLDRFRATADEIANAMTAEGLNCGTARYYLIPAGLLFRAGVFEGRGRPVECPETSRFDDPMAMDR